MFNGIEVNRYGAFCKREDVILAVGWGHHHASLEQIQRYFLVSGIDLDVAEGCLNVGILVDADDDDVLKVAAVIFLRIKDIVGRDANESTFGELKIGQIGQKFRFQVQIFYSTA